MRTLLSALSKQSTWSNPHEATGMKRPAWSSSREKTSMKQFTWSNPHKAIHMKQSTWNDKYMKRSTCLSTQEERTFWKSNWMLHMLTIRIIRLTTRLICDCRRSGSIISNVLDQYYWTAHDRRVASGLFAGTAHRSVAVSRHQLSKHQLESVLTVVPPTRQLSLAIRLQCRPKRRLQCRSQRRLHCRLQLC